MNITSLSYIFSFEKTKFKDKCYYRTFSKWTDFAEKGRDIRVPDKIIVDNAKRLLKSLELKLQKINCSNEFRYIIESLDANKRSDWFLIEDSLLKSNFTFLLDEKVCLSSPFGVFWDKKIKRLRAGSRRTTHLRKQVLKRDNYNCIICGKSSSDGVVLTLDHVIPYSRGGETTKDNLVTLCENCNILKGNKRCDDLFGKAGLHHNYDKTEIKTKLTPKTFYDAIRWSSNIMISEFKIDLLECYSQKLP